MIDEDLSKFQLLGHDCPIGCYPAPVVPIGKLAGRLVAIYHSEEGQPEAVEIVGGRKFVMHDRPLTAALSSYNASTDLLFVLSPREVEFYNSRYEKVDLLRFRESCEDPFSRLALSSATDSLQIIEHDVRACLQNILISAPELAPHWYAKWYQRLNSREPTITLPTDFRAFLGLQSGVTPHGATTSRGALLADVKQSSAPLIRLESVQKIFVTDEVETHALIDINMSVHRGEYLMIGGPSGCGKSSLLAILGLLDSPTAGKYYLNGISVSDFSQSERARIRNREIGFIFQAFNLIGELTVYENVELPLKYRGMPTSERRHRVLESLERVGMAHRMRHMPSQLSGGQQQRVAMARALSGNPLILLADEPTGNLDSENGRNVMELLQELYLSGSTICMVSHDPRYVPYATHVVSMFDGRIVDEAEIVSPTR